MNMCGFCAPCVQLFGLCVHGCVCMSWKTSITEKTSGSITRTTTFRSLQAKTIYMLITKTAVMTCNKKTSAAPSDLISEHHQSRPLLFGIKPLVTLLCIEGNVLTPFTVNVINIFVAFLCFSAVCV